MAGNTVAGNTVKSIAVKEVAIKAVEVKAIEPIDLYDLINRLVAGTATLAQVVKGLSETSGISDKDRQILLKALRTNNLSMALNGITQILENGFIDASKLSSPLVLDLNGDGVKTTGLSAGTHFDHDGNRFAEATGWVDKQDGLLVWDRNGNGDIDNGSELFGSNTVNKDRKKAANGFSALADLDSNKDGKVDAKDAAYKELRVWKDTNGDGKVQAGELFTLEAAGVKSLNTGFKESKTVDSNGNEHRQIGSFTKTDGTTAAMEDIWFKVDLVDTQEKDIVKLSDRVKALPNIFGFGNVHSLQQAMAQDSSGKLLALMENFVAAKNVAAKQALMLDIIYRWAGVQDVSPSSRGPYIGDARKLAALEKFLGRDFIQTLGLTSSPGFAAASKLLSAFDALSNFVYGQFTLQTPGTGSLPDSIKFKLVGDTIQVDVSGALENIKKSFAANELQGTRDAYELTQALKSVGPMGTVVIKKLIEQGAKGNDAFSIMLANAVSTLMIGNGVMIGTGADEYMVGGNGNDTINGGAGNDILIGGKGNDILNGGEGSDTYVFRIGDGNDTINNNSYVYNGVYVNAGSNATTGAIDVVKFVDVKSTDVRLRRDGNDLLIEYGVGDSVRMQNHYVNDAPSRISEFQFADGVKWNQTQMAALGVRLTDGNDTVTFGVGNNVVYAGKGNDYIAGGNGNDILHGEEGNDTLVGGAGNNLLNGGDGNDVLQSGPGSSMFVGGKGNDTIRMGEGTHLVGFNRGDGMDDVISAYLSSANTVSLGNGIRYDDLQLKKSGNDLVLRTGDKEGLTFKNWYSTGYKSISTLQMMIGGSDYDANSTDARRNQKVQEFDFRSVVQIFDQKRAKNPALDSWNMREVMLAFHLNHSNTAAIGGDLAYQYGTTGSLSNVSATNAQALLASDDFTWKRQNVKA